MYGRRIIDVCIIGHFYNFTIFLPNTRIFMVMYFLNEERLFCSKKKELSYTTKFTMYAVQTDVVLTWTLLSHHLNN